MILHHYYYQLLKKRTQHPGRIYSSLRIECRLMIIPLKVLFFMLLFILLHVHLIYNF
jgi:hypothetical protein